MPKPKYPIPNNNFSRFIKEYLSGHSDSQNDLARELNKMALRQVVLIRKYELSPIKLV